MTEEWKDIPGYEGLYQVSTTGIVKSYDKIRFDYRHPINGRLYKSIILRPLKLREYVGVRLTRNYKEATYPIHRLVALTFIPNPSNKPYVNHIDFNTLNNNVTNLEWCTQLENVHHTMKHGRMITPRGEQNGHAKIKDKQVMKIVKMHRSGMTTTDIAKIFKVHRCSIGSIVFGRSFKHIAR